MLFSWSVRYIVGPRVLRTTTTSVSISHSTRLPVVLAEPTHLIPNAHKIKAIKTAGTSASLRGPQLAVLRNTLRTSRFNGLCWTNSDRRQYRHEVKKRGHNRRESFGLRVALGAKSLAVLAAAERPRREERKASFLALGLPETESHLSTVGPANPAYRGG